MIGKALTVASVFVAARAQNMQYVATFSGDNDITGSVTVDYGRVTVSLDLSAMPELVGGGFDACTSGGLSYHIHELWDYNDTVTEAMAGGCGSGYTGGHWDPWNACGAASGNTYCGDGTGTQCIPKADYSVDFPADPFSAEVGDWSNKYAKLELDDDNMIEYTGSSFFEAIPEEMEGYSVVFHCNDGSRAFCASFEEADTATETEVPGQGGDVDAMAIFSELLVGALPSEITISSDGVVSGLLDVRYVFTDAASDGCDSFEYGVFEAGNTALDNSAVGVNCEGAVGDFYDPTHQCPSFSGSEYCTDGQLCGDSGYAYDCDFESDRYSCAPADLSGKFGSLSSTAAMTISSDDVGTESLVPLASDLVGKVMAVYCAEEDQSDLTVFACAPIKGYNTTTDNDDSASRVFGVGAALVALVAALW